MPQSFCTNAAEAWGKERQFYKPLPKEFRRDGFQYRQIARKGDAAIYEQTWNCSRNPSIAYEVVVALGSAIKLTQEDLERFLGRRVRIPADANGAGEQASMRIAQQLAAFSDEVQLFNLQGLNRDDNTPVKDLFDVTRIDYDDFEANRDLWSITNLETKGERVKTIPAPICFSDFSKIIPNKREFLPSPPSPPHVSPESHRIPVYPVSRSEELEKELEELARRNACTARNSARKRRFQLLRDLAAVEKRIGRKLSPDELSKTFSEWYCASQPHLDPKKTRDDYLGSFFGELGKVRVPTGDDEALKIALARVSTSPLPELPGMPDAAESWRRLAALHRELARQSANGTYFLSCRDAAKASPGLSHQTAYNINLAFDRVGVIKIVRVGDARPGGNASEFRYLLPL